MPLRCVTARARCSMKSARRNRLALSGNGQTPRSSLFTVRASQGDPMKHRTASFTDTPETAAPQLLCPTCDRPLVYRQTVFNGVNPLERWDYYDCRTCGPFEYRQRTRRLRLTDSAPELTRYR